jgi:methionyl-tRNA formyltransferase
VKLAVAATAPFGAAVLERLAARHEIELVLTRPDRPKGRGRRVTPGPARAAAGSLGIAVRDVEPLEAFPGSAAVVVVAAYGLMIPERLLDERLWLNVHPSLLPRWRGAAPVERAIMAGDRETGVTVHRTTAELDAGPIAARHAFAVGPEDDAGAVFERAADVAVELLDDVLPSPSFVPQPAGGVTYAEKIGPADRILDWSRPPQETVDRVRALSPHIGARGVVRGRSVVVWRARVAGPGAPLVEGDVELLELQPEGGRRMTAAEWLRGLR